MGNIIRKIIVSCAIAALFCSTGLGKMRIIGGGSDGGGGVSNPPLASLEDIALINGMQNFILMWSNMEEAFFERLEPRYQSKSPYFKLFRGQRKFSDIIMSTGFEVRMSQTCFDAKGVPKDASVYSSTPGYLCFSPYSLFGKLNEYTYRAEVAALMIHELSHVAGASEVEAELIQKDALETLYKMNIEGKMLLLALLLDVPENTQVEGGYLKAMMKDPLVWAKGPMENLKVSYRDVEDWGDYWDELGKNCFDVVTAPLLYAQPETLLAYSATKEKIDVLKYFVCQNDERLDDSKRSECAREMDIRFGRDTQLTARQIVIRRAQFDPGPNYDLVTINKPQNWRDAENIIREVSVYVDQIHAEAKKIFEFSAPVIVKH
ncbi:MAG: hypothetical protein ACM3MG_12600 [Bacillota bacterium]